MQIYSALKMGDFHTHHCEDYLLIEQAGKDMLLCAVMDGCTMGNDSYFASTLVAKLLRKIIREKSYKEFYKHIPHYSSLEENLKYILQQLFQELKQTRNLLLLDTNELLTTLIITLLHQPTQQALVLVIGDGVVSVNGEISIFEQDNKPDYLAYHLSEDFEKWYDEQTQWIKALVTSDICIATDGIETFMQIASPPAQATINPIDFLLIAPLQKEETLTSRLNMLENTFHLRPSDDLAIIRIVHTEQD